MLFPAVFHSKALSPLPTEIGMPRESPHLRYDSLLTPLNHNTQITMHGGSPTLSQLTYRLLPARHAEPTYAPQELPRVLEINKYKRKALSTFNGVDYVVLDILQVSS